MAPTEAAPQKISKPKEEKIKVDDSTPVKAENIANNAKGIPSYPSKEVTKPLSEDTESTLIETMDSHKPGNSHERPVLSGITQQDESIAKCELSVQSPSSPRGSQKVSFTNKNALKYFTS